MPRLARYRDRLRPRLLPIGGTAVAAAVSWQLASVVHPQPVFASVAAIIAMTANVGRRGRQAAELMLGIAIGIALAELVVWGVGTGVWQLGVAIVIGMAVPTALGMPSLVVAQSAVWIALVTMLRGQHLEVATHRFVDAAIGAGVAIVIAQLLFPVRPVRMLTSAEEHGRKELANALDSLARALARRDEEAALEALDALDRLDNRDLHEALAVARDVAHRAPRRLADRRAVDAFTAAVEALSRAGRDARTVATGAVRMLRSGDAPAPALVEAVRSLAAAWREDDPERATTLAGHAGVRAGEAASSSQSLGVQVVLHAVETLADDAMRRIDALTEVRAVTPRPSRSLSDVIAKRGSVSAMTETTVSRTTEGQGFIRESVRNRRLLGVAIIAAIGGFLFGYDTGVIGGAMLFMKGDLGLDTHGKQQLTVAILLLGAIVGALISGWLAGRIGRRRTKIISGCVYVIGAIGCALAMSYWQILAGRFWLGLAVGTASFVAPMYIAELVPPRIRGGVVSFNQLMVTLGILVAYIVDWGFAGFANNWRWMFALAVVPGAALAIGMYFMPFSPRWLVEKGREDEARNVLDRYRFDEDDVEGEIDEIKDVSRHGASVRDLIAKGVRRMMVVGIGLAIFQQIVGINTVIYYAPTILKFAGQQNTGALTQSVYIGCTNVFFTIVAILLLDKLGRRFFLLFGTSCLTLALVGLGIFFHSPSVQSSVSWLALACLLFYIFGFAIGLGPVFWLMISEIFPLQMRAPAMAVCTMFNWGFNFLIAYTFLSLTDAITKAGAFWLYAFFGICALVFFATLVPETKDRSLEQIQSDLGADADEALTRERSRRPEEVHA